MTATGRGSGITTGSVTFKDGSTVIGSAPLTNGAGTFLTSSLSTSAHTITAPYGGDPNFTQSVSTGLSQLVTKANSSSAIASSANPSASGQAVTFQVTVSLVPPSAGMPTGRTVELRVGGILSGTSNVVGGTARFTLSTLAIKSHSVTPASLGDANANGSTAPAISQVVSKAGSTVTLVSSANPSVYGQTFTNTATVSPAGTAGGFPAGTGQFKLDGATARTPVTLTNGVATWTTTTITVGTHAVTTVYSGSLAFAPSTTTVSQTVTKADTVTIITSSVNPVTPGAGTPTGTVQFILDGVNLGPTVSLTRGTATKAVTLPVGPHTITAVYGGHGGFDASTSQKFIQTST